jgi:hypothetical protein
LGARRWCVRRQHRHAARTQRETLLDYRSHKHDALRWLSAFGKNLDKGEGYSDSTVIQNGYERGRVTHLRQNYRVTERTVPTLYWLWGGFEHKKLNELPRIFLLSILDDELAGGLLDFRSRERLIERCREADERDAREARDALEIE